MGEARIEQILTELNTYESEVHPEMQAIWMELIMLLPEYDAEATSEIDTGFRNDIFALKDGTCIRWDYEREVWVQD